MELRVSFRRTQRRTVVFGEKLDAARARAVARLWKRRIHETKSWMRALITDGRNMPARDREAVVKWLAEPGEKVVPLGAGKFGAEKLVRARRGKAIWVALGSGAPSKELPSLQQIAQLQSGGVQEWVDFLRKYDLPSRVHDHIVMSLPESGYELHRVPMQSLREVARQGAVLLACEYAALGQPTMLRKELGALRDPDGEWIPGELEWGIPGVGWPEEDTDASLAEFARMVIASSLEAALDSLEPGASPGVRGITDEWALYAWGWWPLVVLDEFIHKSRYAAAGRCAAQGCSRLVPAHRVRGRWAAGKDGAHYCSERCRQREKKRRQRPRRSGSLKGRAFSHREV